MATLTHNGTCPYCRQAIDPQSRKCYHCGENVTPRAGTERFVGRIVGYAGLLTAVLSTLFGLREGYHWVLTRQETREALDAYTSAADYFETHGETLYADEALAKALAISPDNLNIRFRLFTLRSDRVLSELDFTTGTDARIEEVRNLVSDGFALLGRSLPDRRRARVLVLAGRLLQKDKRWSDADGIARLFDEAYRLAPGHPEVLFHRGQWLVDSDAVPEGLVLMQRAVEAEPDNAYYQAWLGKQLLEAGRFAEAVAPLRSAYLLRETQPDLYRTRAADNAKVYLRRLLVDASAQTDITSDGALGLPLEERLALASLALEGTRGLRDLEFVAARLHERAGALDSAIAHARRSLASPEFDYLSRDDLSRMAYLIGLLDASGADSLARAARQAVEGLQDRIAYQEIRVVGDTPRFKVGLKVASEPSDDGVLVVRVFEGYPFERAGVRPGDRIVEFAHKEVRAHQDVWVPLVEFRHGDRLPMKVVRNGRTVSLEFTVE